MRACGVDGGILSSAIRSDHFDLDDFRYLVSTPFAELVFTMFQESEQHGESFRDFIRSISWENHLILSNTNTRSAGMNKRLPQLIKDKHRNRVRGRIGYRIQRRNPQANGVIRQSALDRYGEITLGSMIDLLHST